MNAPSSMSLLVLLSPLILGCPADPPQTSATEGDPTTTTATDEGSSSSTTTTDPSTSLDTDACTDACQLATCGDGVVQGAEECDDANDIDTDACTNACKFAVCGDGIIHEGEEECDDANDDNGDPCLNACIAARCGDGVLHEGVEECDDANEIGDDGCNSVCARDRQVFLTSTTYAPHQLFGLDGADIECRQAAKDHGLANPDAFRAWLSDATESPATRFVHAQGRYVLPGGEPIALDWDDLTDGELLHPIDTTADGDVVDTTLVWTNTAADGTPFGGDGEDCEGWTKTDGGIGSYVGVSAYSDGFWTHFDEKTDCGSSLALYCFEN